MAFKKENQEQCLLCGLKHGDSKPCGHISRINREGDRLVLSCRDCEWRHDDRFDDYDDALMAFRTSHAEQVNA